MAFKLFIAFLVALGGLLVALVFLLFTMGFWFLAMPFYHQCNKVQSGMSTVEAQQIMAKYLDNPRVHISQEWGQDMSAPSGHGMYMSTKELDMRCIIFYEGDKVSITQFWYD